MATRNPLVLVAGQQRELASGDTLPATAIPAVVAAEVHAAASKATPVDADEFFLVDSAASWAAKKLSWLLMRTALAQYFREKLTATRSYYVRSDGSDSNNGLANTSGGAFLTIQKAVDVVASLDLGIYDVTIYVGAGTWTAPVTLKTLIGASKVTIRGVNADMTSTVISTTAADCFTGVFMGQYRLEYMKLQTATSGSCINVAGGGAVLRWANVNFGAAGGANHVIASAGALVDAAGAYTISGGGYSHISAYDCANARISGISVTISGTPAFTGAFAVSGRVASLLAVSVTFSGAATGKRYMAEVNGVITTLGGATFLPGDTAGTTSTGGQYA